MFSTFELQAPDLIYSDSHISIRCTFEDGGTPVDISSPTFRLYQGTVTGDPEVTSEVTFLKSAQKDETGQAGHYIVTFLSENLRAGTYLGVFTGTSGTEEIVNSSILTLESINRVQFMINMIRSSLKGRYNLLVPNNLMTIDARSRTWEDGEVYDCLYRSVQDLNTVPPLLDVVFTVQNYPEIANNFVVMGAQIYALLMAGGLEAQNYFQANTPINLNLFRGDKFLELMRACREMYLEPMKAWKLQFWFDNIEEQLLVMRRVPIRVVRPMSDEVGFHRISY